MQGWTAVENSWWHLKHTGNSRETAHHHAITHGQSKSPHYPSTIVFTKKLPAQLRLVAGWKNT